MEADALSTTFAALADPTRRAILQRLAKGSATVQQLSEPFAISGPAISKHLRVLEHAGLIRRTRDAQFRPCHLQAAPLKEVADWTETYRRFWALSFDRLDQYLEELQSGSPTRDVKNEALSRESRRQRPTRSASHAKGPKQRKQQPRSKRGRSRNGDD